MATTLELTAAAALFDMDGTLIDSTAVVEALWRRFCSEHRVDAAALLAFAHGRPTRQTVDHFLARLPENERGAIATVLERRELDVVDGIVEIPGARALLQGLPLPWAVVTSAPRTLAVRRLAAAGLPPPSVLVPADEVPRGKPAPDPYLRAADLLGVDSAGCVAFEDAEPGVRSALAAGARVVVVGSLDTQVTAGLDRVPDLRGVSLGAAT
jgi:sugar-phosphatase